MKRIKNIIFGALFFGLPVLVAGCSDDETKDTTAPSVTIENPVNSTLFYRGQSLILNGVFADDRELSHVTLTVHTLKAARGIDTPWEATETIELTGKEHNIASYELFGAPIPSDIMSGNYYLDIVVVDKALNESKTVIAIEIE